MHRLLLVALFLSAVVLAAWYPHTVYISAAEPFVSATSKEPPLLHFWADRKHAAMFHIGNQYLLLQDSEHMSGRLFSITYATARPDKIKLGLYLDNVAPVAIVEQQVFGIRELHGTE